MLSPCNTSNFFTHDKNAFTLMETFCKCPMARDLINLVTTPLEVTVGDFSTAQTDHVFYNKTLEMNLIKIPEQRTEEGRITGLAFEVFNVLGASNTSTLVFKGATMSMDLFAREAELQELRRTRGYGPLLQSCQKEWGISQKLIDRQTLYQDWNEEDHLIEQEIACHTDGYRLQWIKLHQNIYCKNHPEDLRSCETKPDQLCDKENPEEKARTILQRFCTLFPQLSERSQERHKALMKEVCPEMPYEQHVDL
jgi:hypothetical protein